MSIEIDSRPDGVTVVSVSGDISFGGGRLGRSLDLRGRSTGDLAVTLAQLLNDGTARIVLDLSGTRFIDSAGFGSLVAFKKRALERDGDVVLVVGEGRIRELFSSLRLDSVFSIHPSVEEAVAAV